MEWREVAFGATRLRAWNRLEPKVYCPEFMQRILPRMKKQFRFHSGA